MTNYEFGQVVLVPFPFTDQLQKKKRPAVIVSSAAYNLARPDVVLIAITSKINLPLKVDEIEIEHWQDAGLLKPSVIKPVFTTIEKSLILRKLGNIDEEAKVSVRDLLHAILG